MKLLVMKLELYDLEAGEGARGGAPLGGGSEDGAGALLPVASGVVRETGGERSVGIA